MTLTVGTDPPGDETGSEAHILQFVESGDQTAHLFAVFRRLVPLIPVALRHQIHAVEEAAVLDRRPPAECVGQIGGALLRRRQHDLAFEPGVVVHDVVFADETAPDHLIDLVRLAVQFLLCMQSQDCRADAAKNEQLLEHRIISMKLLVFTLSPAHIPQPRRAA